MVSFIRDLHSHNSYEIMILVQASKSDRYLGSEVVEVHYTQ